MDILITLIWGTVVILGFWLYKELQDGTILQMKDTVRTARIVTSSDPHHTL